MLDKKLRPTRVLKPQGVNTAIANSTTTSGLRLEFKERGCVLFAIGSVVGVSSNDARASGMCSLGFRIFRQGIEELITDGETAAFLQFDSAFPTAGFRFPLGLDVKENETWLIFFRNLHTGTTFTPDFGVGFAAYAKR
jgi:hypothetical protein